MTSSVFRSLRPLQLIRTVTAPMSKLAFLHFSPRRRPDEASTSPMGRAPGGRCPAQVSHASLALSRGYGRINRADDQAVEPLRHPSHDTPTHQEAAAPLDLSCWFGAHVTFQIPHSAASSVAPPESAEDRAALEKWERKVRGWVGGSLTTDIRDLPHSHGWVSK
jgi:hypothetical protein